jgi:hypothetical protein
VQVYAEGCVKLAPLLAVCSLFSAAPVLALENPFVQEAKAHLAKGDAQAAMRALDKGASWQQRLSTPESEVHLLRGLVFVSLHRPVSAKKAFADALELDPNVSLPPGTRGEARELFALAQSERPPPPVASVAVPLLDVPEPSLPVRAPAVATPALWARPPPKLRMGDAAVSAKARVQPLFYWHQVTGAGRTHSTPMMLPGARLDAQVRTGPFRLALDYSFSIAGVRLQGAWTPSQLHDLTAGVGWPFATPGLKPGSRAVLDVAYTGTWTRFGRHFPRHVSDDNLHRVRVGLAWQTAFYILNAEAELQVGAQVFPYARLYESPVVSGSRVAGAGLGAQAELHLPLAGRVQWVLGLDARWTYLRPTGVSNRPSFHLEQVSSVQQALVAASLGVMLPF